MCFIIKSFITLLFLTSFSPLYAQLNDANKVIESLEALVKNAPEDPKTHQALILATQRPEAKIQQQSWLLFKGIQSKKTNKHLINAINNLSDKAQEHLAAIEILEVAKTFLDPNIKSALLKYQQSHPFLDPLSRWLPSLHGGDAKAGENIFKNQTAAQCAKCHDYNYQSIRTNNDISGPNLAGLAKRMNHLRKDLLEAIIVPNTTIAEGFGTVTVEFEKGKISGNLIAYQSTGIVIQIGDEPRLISYNDYNGLKFAKSTMPSMKDKLTLKEARDLVAFLDTLTDEKGKPVVANIVAKPFQLSELNNVTPTKETSLAEKQKQLYDMNCSACHQPHGEGNETFPPLAGSEWVSGDKETLIKMQLLGLSGPITVKGKIYDGIAMPSNARLSDEDIANILSYIRTNSSWKNNASNIATPEVAKVRKEIGDSTTPLDATTLTHPHDQNLSSTKESVFKAHKTNNLTEKSRAWSYLIILIILCLIPVGIGFFKNK